MSKCKLVVGQLGSGRIFEQYVFGLVLHLIIILQCPQFSPSTSTPWSLFFPPQHHVRTLLQQDCLTLVLSLVPWVSRTHLLVSQRLMGAWVLSSLLSKKGSAHIQPAHQFHPQERMPEAAAQVLAPWRYLLGQNCNEGMPELKPVGLSNQRPSFIGTKR